MGLIIVPDSQYPWGQVTGRGCVPIASVNVLPSLEKLVVSDSETSDSPCPVKDRTRETQREVKLRGGESLA